jgi:hypothetical protein
LLDHTWNNYHSANRAIILTTKQAFLKVAKFCAKKCALILTLFDAPIPKTAVNLNKEEKEEEEERECFLTQLRYNVRCLPLAVHAFAAASR